MSRYYFDSANRFVIEGYNHTRPFASFLPGIAGVMGVPLWVFYVNRAQGIASFGVQDKHSPIIEYFPANKSYQLVSYIGFRTFLKTDQEYYEPFSPISGVRPREERMIISPAEVAFETLSPDGRLRASVVYFTLPGEPFAGLVRMVTVQNVSDRAIEIEALDGLPAILPYGLDSLRIKEICHTAEAWMGVSNLENRVPFYRLRSSMVDQPEVEVFEAGHFCLAFAEDGRLLSPLVDPGVVFGANTALSHPDGFLERPLTALEATRQVTTNKTPCGFFGVQRRLEPGQTVGINAIIGHTKKIGQINGQIERIARKEYLEAKRGEATALIEELTETVATKTSSPLFDAYCRQCLLDNVLRGGYPLLLGDLEKPHVYHVYSRKHGDLERDYNFFSLAPEFYSQGNGNYRDVNQNRRDDVRIVPGVRDFDIRTFVNLIQPDGYNPLVILGSHFRVEAPKVAEILALVEGDTGGLERLLAQPFRPGQLVHHVIEHNLRLRTSAEQFLHETLRRAGQSVEATFGEGYWVDHWVYNLDLIESFLAIYPDAKEALLFERNDYTYYDSPARVLPRDDKHVLVDGQVRQFGAVVIDVEKEALLAARDRDPHCVRSDHGHGPVYKTTLFAKLATLALVKFATLDPYGMGVEMEAEKPGWYDALNGLPGMLGSSVTETYELRRLLAFLCEIAAEYPERTCILPVEAVDLLLEVSEAIRTSEDWPWERIATAREAYRERVRFGFDGAVRELSAREIGDILSKFLDTVDAGIARARALTGGLYPTYFYYEAEEYELLRDADGNPRLDGKGRPRVRVTRFRPVALPLFLEGLVKALKMRLGRESAREIYRRVRESALFDKKLRMYKVNAPLIGQPLTLGRATAFTPGWLENESIWLHMEYKYLLELLRAGLYTEFFDDIKTVLIPFLDPAIYGRSPLENSSFLASSAHPDETVHGAGFVARLTGATAEFLSMWHLMMAGEKPFFVEDGRLCLQFKPALPAWLFDERDTITFKFLGCCNVTYHNPARIDTFDERAQVQRIVIDTGDDTVEIHSPVIREPYASRVRAGNVQTINVYLSQL